MAKKKGLGASFRQQVEKVPVVQQKAPRTISTNVSTNTSTNTSNRGGGLGASFKTATQKAEEDRSARMRQGISSVVRASFKRQMSQPTTVQKSALKPLATNALAPVKNASTGFKMNVRRNLAPMKEIANYTRNQQYKYAATPSMDVVPAQDRKTRINVDYGNKLRAGMPSTNTALMSWRSDPTQREREYRDKYGYTQKVKEVLDRRLNDNLMEAYYSPTTGEIKESENGRAFSAGHTDAWARENVEDTIRRQYGIEPDEETLAKIEAQRGTVNYGAGNMLGQTEQYLLTRGLLGAAGLVGAATKAAPNSMKALRALGKETLIDQAASLPLNMIDAMKADNFDDMVKRFGLNQALDLVFSFGTEGFALLRNPNASIRGAVSDMRKAFDLHTAAKNAPDEATRNALNKQARNIFKGIPDEKLDEVRRVVEARVGNQRPISDLGDERIEAIQNAEGTVGEFPSTDYAYRIGGDRANYDNMRDDMLGAIESQEAIGAGNVPNDIGMRAEVKPYESTAVPKTGVEKVLSDYRMSADELIDTIENPYFDDLQMLDNIADDLFPVGRKRSMEIDAERAYSDNLSAFEEDPALFDGYRPTREEAYMDVLTDNIVNELRRGQMPNVADDVARAVPAEQPAREATQQTARATEKTTEAPKAKAEEPKAEPKADRSKEAWDDIEDVTKANNEPEDLMKKKPNRKENTIPKPSEQAVKKEVFNRGESLGKSNAKEAVEQTAQEAPKRRQVKGILNEDQPKTKYSEMSLHDLQAERHSLEEQVRYDKSGNVENKIYDIDEEFKRRGEEPNWFKVEPEEGGNRVRSPREANAEVERLKKKYGEFKNGLNKKIETDEGVRRNLKTLDTILPEASPEVDHIVKNNMLDGKYAIDDGRTTKDILTEVKANMAENPEAYTNKVVNFDETVDARERIVALETAQAYWKEVGNTEYELKATEALSKYVSESASILKIHGILRRLSKPARMDYLDQTIAKLEKRFEKRLKRAKIDHISVSDETRKMLKEAKSDQETKEAWTRASLEIWNQIPASTKEKMDFIRVNAMLFNPKTHIRNIFGNALFLPLRELKNITGTGLEYIAMKAGALDSSKRTKAIIPLKEGMDYAKNLLKDMGDELRGASRYFENIANDRPMDVDVFMAGRQNGNPFVNGIRKFTDKVGDANAWLLDHEDFVFFNGAFREQFGRVMKARKLTVKDLEKNPALRNDIIEVATEEALRATYRDESAAARLISRWKNPGENAHIMRKAGGVALDAILPFTKTPINILRRAIDYSPVGFGKGGYNFFKGWHDGNQKQVVKGLDQLASAIPGSGLALLGWFMAERDGVTGNLGSEKDDQFMRDLGKQKFSIVFHSGTDKEWSYTLDWAAPGCIPFFSGVAYKELSDGGVSFWEIADTFEKMFEPTMEMSVMQGIKNTAETFQRANDGGVWQGLFSVGVNTGLQYAGQFKPTVVSQTARLIDPVRRDTTSTADTALQRQIERWGKKQIAGIPGLSQKLNPYQNVWGEEESNTYNEDLPMRIIENYFSPGYAKKYKADSVDKEILKIYRKDPSSDGVIPSKFSSYEIGFNDGTVRFSADDRSNFIKVQGKVSKQELRKLFDTDEYKDASLTEKQKMIANAYSNAKIEAKHDTLLKMGKDKWEVYTDEMTGRKAEYQDAKDADFDAEQYYNYMKTKDWDLDESGKPVKSELALYLNKQEDLTDEQRAVIFGKLANGNTKNPYEDGTAHSTDWQAEYEKYLAKKNKEKNGSGGSKKSRSGKRGRSGRRSSGGSSSVKPRAKTESEKRFAALQKMQAPTTGKGIEALSKNAKGLTKAQKKALIKLLQKKLDV